MKNYTHKKKRSNKVVISLIVVVLILVGIIAWALIAKPAINNYTLQKQYEARDIVLQTILMQVEQEGYVQIQNANGETITLARVVLEEPTI
jgi:hypothetical protein